MALYERGVRIPRFFQIHIDGDLLGDGISGLRSVPPAVKSFGVLLALGVVFVPATVMLVRLVVPLFGWRQIFEGP
jgi:hypothetical protein